MTVDRLIQEKTSRRSESWDRLPTTQQTNRTWRATVMRKASVTIHLACSFFPSFQSFWLDYATSTTNWMMIGSLGQYLWLVEPKLNFRKEKQVYYPRNLKCIKLEISTKTWVPTDDWSVHVVGNGLWISFQRLKHKTHNAWTNGNDNNHPAYFSTTTNQSLVHLPRCWVKEILCATWSVPVEPWSAVSLMPSNTGPDATSFGTENHSAVSIRARSVTILAIKSIHRGHESGMIFSKLNMPFPKGVWPFWGKFWDAIWTSWVEQRPDQLGGWCLLFRRRSWRVWKWK